MTLRFGFDLGINSLGWAVLRGGHFDALGVRIFSDGRDPKSKASLAMDRRLARAMRRRRDRFKQRQAGLLKHLVLAGLFPADEAERKALEDLDPYKLRARALHEKLPLPELGRALFHINQRRGFKSNRKADRGKNDESGKIRVGVARLHERIVDAGAETFGEWLHIRRSSATDQNTIPPVRTRLRPESGEGAKGDGYDFYPDRQMLEDEFRAIWRSQAALHPDVLTPEVRDRLHEVIFHQRPLKAPKIGMCTLVRGEKRLPKAHPLFQRRRLLEEINALQIIRVGENPRRLTLAERDALYLKLKDSKDVTFDSLRRVLKLDPEARFNKESESRTKLKGDEVAALMGAKTRFSKRWQHLDPDRQWAVVERVLAQESDADTDMLVATLEAEHKLSAAEALAVANAPLPDGHGRFGETATRKLIDALRSAVIVYSEAVEKAGLGHHSDMRTGEVHEDREGRPALPYYGVPLERHILPGTGDPDDKDEASRFGRLTNPTVHIGLNQLRRVVNTLMRRYGKPDEVVIELARELKMTDEQKTEQNKRNARNQRDAERRSKNLTDIGQVDKGGNRAQLKLWEELNPENVLDRRCIYTGKQISIDMLFSGAVEVDHILPFAATLDDSGANRLLCLREANREKRKRSPYEAFGHGGRYDWEAIVHRAQALPREKRWRFEPDAMQRFDRDGGFLARQLVDTQHLATLAREYLGALYPETGEGSGRVWVLPGRLTEMLRRNWGLNQLLPDHNIAGGANQPKNRLDHRHHAIDAAVIAVTDRGLLNRLSRQAGQQGHEAAERMAAHLDPPWEGFRDELEAKLRRVVVSHRPDHGTVSKAGRGKGRDQTAGRLHNDTAYGFTGEKDARGNDIVVHRVPLDTLKNVTSIEGVRDCVLREALREWLAEREGKEFEARLRSFPEAGPLPYRGLRRVRVVEGLSVIPIRDRKGRIYKGYKGDSNYRYDVWELKDGRWVSEVVSMFDAHQPGWSSAVRAANPTAKKVLSLHRDDVIAVEREGADVQLVRLVKFSDHQIALAPPQEGGALKARAAEKNDPFSYIYTSSGTLKRWCARQVRVDELGRVLDPGFPARKAVRRTRPRPSA